MAEENTDQSDIAELRKRADAATTAESERDQAKRELAFIKAGVDTETEFGKLLMERYDGDLSDKAAVEGFAKQFRTALGIPDPSESTEPEPDPTPTEEAEQRQAIDRITASGQTATPQGQGEKAPGWAKKEGMAAGMERIKEGARRFDAASEFLGRVIDAGVEDTDPDVFYDAEAFHEEARRLSAGAN